MKEKVLQILGQALPEIDFASSKTLVDDGILDSLLLISVVAALTAEFGITIPYTEITENNFNSIDAMTAMVERLMKG